MAPVVKEVCVLQGARNCFNFIGVWPWFTAFKNAIFVLSSSPALNDGHNPKEKCFCKKKLLGCLKNQNPGNGGVSFRNFGLLESRDADVTQQDAASVKFEDMCINLESKECAPRNYSVSCLVFQ